jgi:AcrR family transcriptional regulator
MVKATRSAREQILEVAANLFFRDGFRAVGIDTIIEQSGVAKMTLYRHFPSKDELIVAYLERANAGFWEWWEGAISPYPDAPRQQLLALFEALAKLATNPACYGCSFQVAAAEFPASDHPGHRVALAHKRAVIARLGRMAEQAGACAPGMLAEQLLLLMDGAFVAARMFGPNNPARHVAQAAATLLEAQLDKRKETANGNGTA